jgi:ankyrin repeat protein
MKKVLVIVSLVLGLSSFAQTKNEQLFSAIQNNQKPQVEALLKAGCDVNYFKTGSPDIRVSLLMAAVNANYAEIAKLLLDNKADVNWKDNLGNTAIMHAAYAGNTDMVKLLISYGASVKDSNNNTTVLNNAKASGNKELLTLVEKEMNKSSK